MTRPPIVAAIVVVSVCVAAWLAVPGDEPPAAVREITNATAAAVAAPIAANVADDASAADAVVRTAAAADATSPAPSPRRGWRLGKAEEPMLLPAILPIVVVDLRGEPVASASVSVFEATAPGRRGAGPPRQQAITNAAGRAQVKVEGECLVSAERAGVGWSGDMHLQPEHSRLPDELLLVLLPTATVRGRVLLADGTPAAGAMIFCSCSLGLDARNGNLADADGRFTAQVRACVACSFEAQHRSQRSEPHLEKPLEVGEVRDVTWSFPGGYSVRGLVLDAANQPVEASVRLRDADDAADWGLLRISRCDRDGRFEVLLARAGRYQVIAGIGGHTAACAELTLDAAQPHREATLVLRPFVVVEGRIVDERGEPCVGVKAHLQATSGPVSDLMLIGMAIGLQGSVSESVTDTAGGFRFEAPADCRYRVVAQPVAEHRWLSFDSAEFAAPASGLTIVIGAANRQGFELAGTVVAASTGAPVTDVSIGWGPGASRSTPIGTSSDGTFLVGPFTAGHRYTFEVEAIGFAPTIVGPFEGTIRREQIVVRMQRWASLRARVVRSDGTPAPHAFVSLDPGQGVVASARTWQGETGAGGWITFYNVIPGRYRVRARATRFSDDAPVVEAVASPGEATDVQVALGK